ncbi:MAG TPA: c-type cytochrome [Caulobacteraceae bacterium]|jgi:cytochrome c553|nr:c-type cytochrome [Caulobacteraceae bacterium]
MIRSSLLAGVFVMAAGAAAAAPSGKSIAEHGSAHGAPACSSCHGLHYEGNPGMKAPALAGLSAKFIVARLDHYAGPTGHNAAMRAVATALDAPERRAVAAYLSSLPSPPKHH